MLMLVDDLNMPRRGLDLLFSASSMVPKSFTGLQLYCQTMSNTSWSCRPHHVATNASGKTCGSTMAATIAWSKHWGPESRETQFVAVSFYSLNSFLYVYSFHSFLQCSTDMLCTDRSGTGVFLNGCRAAVLLVFTGPSCFQYLRTHMTWNTCVHKGGKSPLCLPRIHWWVFHWSFDARAYCHKDLNGCCKVSPDTCSLRKTPSFGIASDLVIWLWGP